MNARRRPATHLVPLLMLVLLAGCARLQDRLPGTWKQVNGGWRITFLKDGTVTSGAGPFQVSGKYTTPDEKHVKIEPAGLIGSLAGPQVWDAQMKDGRLLLTINGEKQEFQKVE